ncbi:MAG: hypothetical protein KatS3mg052_1460 [Candidatus Roseilinea sp.]|nr:MAG: hypothetical protein KatS3mg052_1460 [Candidatus Roseilinea sp.]
MANSTARLLITGNAPGIPRHTGHTFTFGSAPKKRALHAQNILLLVSSSTWVSMPMTTSYSISHPSFKSGATSIVRSSRTPRMKA